MEPGETVIKEGTASYQWEEGRLYLTNRHLFWRSDSALFREVIGSPPLSAEIPLRNIRKVGSRGWPVYILTVLADKEYKFGGTDYFKPNTKEWAAAIEQARQIIQTIETTEPATTQTIVAKKEELKDN